MIQGSPEWFAARLGKVGASRVADLLAKTRTGWGASRSTLMAQLIAERLTGEQSETYSNAAMQWGTDTEAEARSAYEFRTDATVALAGFIDHPTIAMSGASPDGLISWDGLVEIKCPATATHLDVLLSGAVPGKYATQMMWQMAVTGRDYCDFVSYDPRLPETMRLFVRRVQRDEERVAELEREVAAFLDEVDEKIAALEFRYGDGPHPIKAALKTSLTLMAG